MRVNNHHTNHQQAYQQNYANPGNSSGTRESQGDQRAVQTANHGQRSRSNGDQSDLQQKLKAMVTQVPQGQINPAPAQTGTQNQKYRSKTQGGGVKPAQGARQQKGKQQNWGLLGPQPDKYRGLKTLVLDLDETLVHSQFNQIKNPHYVIPVDIEGNVCSIYVQKRPGVDNFLKVMSNYYELVIFTASLSKYADPLMNQMDTNGYCTMRLFREHCTYMNGVFTKDMSKIGRAPNDAIILDNSPSAYMLQPEQAMPIISWYDDPKDRQLYDLIPLLIQLSRINDPRQAVTQFVKNNQVEFNFAKSICNQILSEQERLKQIQMQQQMQMQQKLQKQQEQAEKQQQLQIANAKQQKEQQQNQNRTSIKQSSKDEYPSSYSQNIDKKQSSKNQYDQENRENSHQDRDRKQKSLVQRSGDTAETDLEQSQAPNGPTTMGPPTGDNGLRQGHQKMKSIDVQKPLINPWVAANHSQQNANKHLTSKNIQQQLVHEQQMINLRNKNQLMNDSSKQKGTPGAGETRTHKRYQSQGMAPNPNRKVVQNGFQGIPLNASANTHTGQSSKQNVEAGAEVNQSHGDLDRNQQLALTQNSQIQNQDGGTSTPSNGVTNITNIIYNFNLTPSQQLHKQQIEQEMMLQEQQQQQQMLNGTNGISLDGSQSAQAQITAQPGSSSQGQRKIATQGGNRPSSSKRNSGNGVNYPLINNGQQLQESPHKGRVMMNSHQQMHSLDRSQLQQISQGIQIRDSYKEQQQQIQNQLKRRPQTGGNNQQAYLPGDVQNHSRDNNQQMNSQQQMANQSLNGQFIKQKTHGAIGAHINKRSISGASNKNQFQFNQFKGHSSTPKNQNLHSSGITNFRSGGHTGVNMAANANQGRVGHQMKNMTQVINMKDHLPSDLRTGANNGSMHHQRLYLAQQKLSKQLKLNTNDNTYLRYGQQKGREGLGIHGSSNAGNITTTASQHKSNGPSLFNFGPSNQNMSGYSVGGLNDRSGASLRRSNKQRSHSSSNNAGINQSNIVFIGSNGQAQQQKPGQAGVDPQGPMIAISNKQLSQQMPHHARTNSDANHGSRRHDDFIKDQKRQAAEIAITDKYAASAMIAGAPQNHRNYLTSSNEAADSGNIVGGISNMAAMSQSYRNVGQTANGQPTGNQVGIYDKLRNSYQSPNQFISSEMMSSSFHNKQSPKIGGQGGVKQLKINSNSHSFNDGSRIPNSKNVKIMLVGNNGTKGNQYKANIVDQNGMNYGVATTLPKTTKNNISKFYTDNSGGGRDIQNGFLNAIGTPQGNKNSFRHDGLSAQNNKSMTMAQGSSNNQNMVHNVNIRQSAQIERGSSSNGAAGSQAFSSVQFNQTVANSNNQTAAQGKSHGQFQSSPAPRIDVGTKKLKQNFAVPGSK